MSKTKFIFINIILSVFYFNICDAQEILDKKTSTFIADSKFSKGSYEAALEDYLILHEKDPSNEKYAYNIAVCFLNTNINRLKAIPYLEKLISSPKADPNVSFLLARAYQYAYRFDEAIKLYNQFKEGGKGTTQNIADVDRQIQFCINAKELVKFPVDVTFENLGMQVNSPYADYYGFVPNNESFIIFNTKRPDEGGELLKEDGTYPSAIYISKVTNGNFSKAKNIGAPIEKENAEQEIIGLSANGENMILYYTDKKGEGDIYLSVMDKDKSNQFKAPVKLGVSINSTKKSEIAASITNDGSIIYFVSDKEDGIGGTDLYMSKRLPNGNWGIAQNLGAEINTALDEDFPNISPDGKTLYFSSNGRTGMGGYDIFKAKMDEISGKFVNPKNMGYPVNTPEDNYNFRLSQNERYGYMSALKEGGMGDLDIYRLIFNGVEPEYSVIIGSISSADVSKKVDYSTLSITVTNSKTQELIGSYLPNPYSGRYVMVLAPGTFDISIEAEGFTTINERINILDKSSFEFEITKDVLLKLEKQ